MADIAFNPSDPIIKLPVGNGPDTLQVHQGILCRSSKFFKNALKAEWVAQKADPHTISLPDDALEDVNLYIRSLYLDELIVDTDVSTNETKANKLFETLLHAYIYSEKIQDTIYNKAIFKILNIALTDQPWIPGIDDINFLYEKSSPCCLARSMVTAFVAHACYFDSASPWNDDIKLFSQEVLVDIVKAMSELRGGMADKRSSKSIGREFLDKI